MKSLKHTLQKYNAGGITMSDSVIGSNNIVTTLTLKLTVVEYFDIINFENG